MKLHVAYCTATFPSRSEAFIRREISYLRTQEIMVTVYALKGYSDPDFNAECTVDGIHVTYRPSRMSPEAWRAVGWLIACRPLQMLVLVMECLILCLCAPRLALMLAANIHAIALFSRDAMGRKITLVHGCFLNLPGLVAMGMSIVAGKPLTVAGHAYDVFVDGSATATLARRACSLIVCHASAANVILRRITEHQRRKVQVLHHGLDGQEHSPREIRNVQGNRVTIMAMGRFVPKKGYVHLIRACAQLRDAGMCFRLIMVGDGPQGDELRRMADRWCLGDCVVWAGWCGKERAKALLSEASVLVIPSIIGADGDRDGIPNVLLEAWAGDVPVIASALPSITEAVVDEVHGLLVTPGDEVHLAYAIDRLLGSPELQMSLRMAGRRRLKEKFNLHVNGEKLICLFKKAHNGGAAA